MLEEGSPALETLSARRESRAVHAAAAALSAPGAVGITSLGLKPGLPVLSVRLNLCAAGLDDRSDLRPGEKEGGSFGVEFDGDPGRSEGGWDLPESELDLPIQLLADRSGEEARLGGSGGGRGGDGRGKSDTTGGSLSPTAAARLADASLSVKLWSDRRNPSWRSRCSCAVNSSSRRPLAASLPVSHSKTWVGGTVRRKSRIVPRIVFQRWSAAIISSWASGGCR